MPSKHKRVKEISNCCGAPAKVYTSPDDIDKLGCTMYYVCTECGEPCNIIFKQRKTWKINPKTRITPNKKLAIPKIKERLIEEDLL